MTKFFLFLISFLLFPTFSNAQDWPIKGTSAWPNDKDFNDTCEVIPFGVDFGFCAMALGWALTDSGCVVLSGCSWVGSDGIDYTSSFFGSLDACNSACLQDTINTPNCIDSSLIDLSVFCPSVVAPVCGCDSLTYQNACQATYYYGVISYYSGACVTSQLQNRTAEQLLVLPNPNNGSFIVEKLPIGSLIQIFNLVGEVIYEVISDKETTSIDISKASKGLYLLTIDHQFGEKIRIE